MDKSNVSPPSMFIYYLVSSKTGCNVEKIHAMRTEANPDPVVRCSDEAQNVFFYTTTRLPKKLRFNRPSLSMPIIIIM